MKRIDELDDQIAKLQAEREQLLAAERKQALVEVKRIIARFQFTTEELNANKTLSGKRKRRTKAEMAAFRAAQAREKIGAMQNTANDTGAIAADG